nr:hypothetical protein [uncultured Actinoplanes sp.]
MSTYQMQKVLFDYLRAREHAPKDEKPDIATVVARGYDLDDEERKAVEDLDLGKLYALGTHPVIINGLARNMGYRKADYRPLLAGSMPPERKVKPRWLKS